MVKRRVAPSKGLPTVSISPTTMDAASYLTQLHERSSTSPSSPSRSSSLISYGTSTSTASTRARASSDAAKSDDSATSSDSEQSTRSTSWRGISSIMPTPSHISASRPPTTAFDVDFIPDPDDPYSLRHSEYGYDVDPAHRTVSRHTPGMSLKASDEEPSVWVYLQTYLSCTFTVPLSNVVTVEN